MRVVFSIAGTPKGKERPRVVDGPAYTPKGTKDYEAMCAYMYKISARRRMFRGPVKADITAIWTPPASARKAQLKLMQPGMPCCHKPDGDNIAKITLDSLNGRAWHDHAAVSCEYHGIVTPSFSLQAKNFIRSRR